MISALVGLAAVGVYLNSLGNAFVYDDIPICVKDQRCHGLDELDRIFTQGYWARSDTSIDGLEGRPKPLFRPVTLLSFAVNHELTGLHPTAYRLVNILLHAGTAIGVVCLVRLILPNAVVALAAGLVFAVHPIHVEAVVPAVGRSEVLAAITAVWAVVLHMRDAHACTGPRQTTWRYPVVILLMWVGVFSKESAITTVGLLLAAEVWLKVRGPGWARELGWRGFAAARLPRRYIGYLAVAVAFLVARRLVLGQFFSSMEVIPVTQNILMEATLPQRLLTCMVVLWKYVYLLFVPYPLCYDYSAQAVRLHDALGHPSVLAGLACAAAMAVGVILSARRHGHVAVAILFFAVTYSVASNILVRIGTLMAERLVYLPSVGVCMLIGLALGAVASRWPRRIAATPWGDLRAGMALALACLIGIVTTYSVLTVRRNTVWQSNETLYTTDLAIQPESHKCWQNLGQLRMEQGRGAEAIECFERALELAPNAYEMLARLGWYEARAGRVVEALDLLERASENAWRTETFTLWVRAQLHTNLGQLDQAVPLYERVLEIKPTHEIALVNLTALYASPESGRRYDLDKAYAYAKRAAALPSPQPNVFVALADVCVKSERWDEARQAIARGTGFLNAYEAKAKRTGKVENLAPAISALRQALRELAKQVTATRPVTTP